MKSGFLKKVVLYSISTVGIGLIVSGVIGIAKHNTNATYYQRKEILKNYSSTQEFKTSLNKEIDYYQDMYEKGFITLKDYKEKVDECFSQNYIKNTIYKNENQEYINKLNQKEIEIEEKLKNTNISYLISGFGGIVWGIPLAVVFSEKDAKKRKKETENNNENEENVDLV